MSTARLALPTSLGVHRRIAAWHLVAVPVALIALGAGLRLCGARGDLWLDEIWTLDLLRPITSVGEIIWGINNDNNHFLNSIYLWIVGPDASVMVQRAFSAVLATGAIAAAGLASWRGGRAAALIAMLLFAVSYPMVHYGSEARGYAGLVLFSVAALICLERELACPHWANRHGLGLAVGLGLMSHLTMLASAAVLALWTGWVMWRRTGSLRAAEAGARLIFRPALAWSLAIGAGVLFGALRHGFTVGGVTPFEPMRFVDGYGGLIRLSLGLPAAVPAWACLIGAAAAVLAAAWFWRARDDRRTSLYVAGVVGLPAAMFAAHLPNLQFGRYFLFSATMLLLFVADAAGRAWHRGGVLRATAVAALLAILAGNAVSLRQFFEHGRGHYADAVARMAADGPFVYASDQDFRNPMLVDFFSGRLGVPAQYATSDAWCRVVPDWMVIENPQTQRESAELTVGAPECALRFARLRLYPAWGLSGWQWALYRRVP